MDNPTVINAILGTNSRLDALIDILTRPTLTSVVGVARPEPERDPEGPKAIMKMDEETTVYRYELPERNWLIVRWQNNGRFAVFFERSDGRRSQLTFGE